MKEIPTQMLPIGLIEPNKGQIEGLPKNPRLIRDEHFKKLKKSIEDNPEMLYLRELLVYPHQGKYVVIGGNMRLMAMRDLGYNEAPCKVIPEDTTAEQLKAYTIKDNAAYGEWDYDLLANEWDVDQLDDWCIQTVEQLKEEETAQNADARDNADERKRDPESEIIVATVSLFGTTEDMMLTQQLTTEEADQLIQAAKSEGGGNLMKRIIAAL